MNRNEKPQFFARISQRPWIAQLKSWISCFPSCVALFEKAAKWSIWSLESPSQSMSHCQLVRFILGKLSRGALAMKGPEGKSENEDRVTCSDFLANDWGYRTDAICRKQHLQDLESGHIKWPVLYIHSITHEFSPVVKQFCYDMTYVF